MRYKRIKLNKPALKELLYWVNLSLVDCTVCLRLPTGIAHLYTDASSRLWGAVFKSTKGDVAISGFFPPDLADAHIHLKELYAVFAAV